MSNPNKRDFTTKTAAEMKKRREGLKTRTAKDERRVIASVPARTGAPRLRGLVLSPVAEQVIAAGLKFMQTQNAADWNAYISTFTPGNRALLIGPELAYNYDQRFAVFMTNPRGTTDAPGKRELLAILPGAFEVNFQAAGRAKDYTYAPQFVDPLAMANAYLNARVTPEVFTAWRDALRHYVVPPLVGNMAREARIHSEKQWPGGYGPYAANASANTKYNPPRRFAVFPQSPSLPSLQGLSPAEQKALTDKFREDLLEVAFDWLMYSQFSEDDWDDDKAVSYFHNTSVGAPFNMTKPSTGELGWGRKLSPQFTQMWLDPKTGPAFALLRALFPFVQSAMSMKKADSPLRKDTELSLFDQVSAAQAIGMKYAAETQATRVPSNLNQLGSDMKKPADFWSHTLFTAGAGNVKTVTLDDIKDGKPNRTIYMASALIDMLGAKFGEMYEEGVFNEWTEHSSFAYGGASEVIKMMVPDLTKVRFAPAKIPEGPFLERILVEDTIFVMPDMKKADMNEQQDYIDEVHRDFARLFSDPVFWPEGLSQTDRLVRFLVAAAVGFYCGVVIKPSVLWNAGVVSTPKRLNPSGCRTTKHNNMKKSGAAFLELKRLLPSGHRINFTLDKESLHFFVQEVRGVARGDDALWAIRFSSVFDDNEKVKGGVLERYNGNAGTTPYSRVAMAAQGAWRRTFEGVYSAEELDDQGKKVIHNHIGYPAALAAQGATVRLITPGIAQKIEKTIGTVWKPELLIFQESISDGKYLGAHIYAVSEGEKRDLNILNFDDVPILAARPLSEILNTVVTPRARADAKLGITPAVHGALRALAAYIEGAVAYPFLRAVLPPLYDLEGTAAGSVSWDSPDMRSELASCLSNVHVFGDDNPLDVLEDEDWRIGEFPTYDVAYTIATGFELPVSELAEEDALPALSGAEEDFDQFQDDVEPPPSSPSVPPPVAHDEGSIPDSALEEELEPPPEFEEADDFQIFEEAPASPEAKGTS